MVASSEDEVALLGNKPASLAFNRTILDFWRITGSLLPEGQTATHPGLATVPREPRILLTEEDAEKAPDYGENRTEDSAHDSKCDTDDAAAQSQETAYEKN